MPNTSILADFLPYTWYDISLYPTHHRVGTYESHPRVDVIIKYYDPESDLFRYYKSISRCYNGAWGHEGHWDVEKGHRVVAFMWDGDDIQIGADRSENPTTHPVLMLKGIAATEREKARIALLAKELGDTSPDGIVHFPNDIEAEDRINHEE